MEGLERYSLADKHILVTGASSGIGYEIARHINKLGARVTGVARNEDRLNELLGQLAGSGNTVYPFDLSNVEEIEDLVKRMVVEQGKFDGMMFCAGIGEHVPIAMTKPTYSQKVMQVNYFSYCETLRCLAKPKNYNKGASYIGMSSVSGMQGDKYLLAYSASKGAMNSAMRCAAVEFAEKGIRVNNIATGYIRGTRIVNAMMDRLGTEEVETFVTANQPLGMGVPQNIADMAAFLLSEASSYITGTIMLVDGGYMA